MLAMRLLQCRFNRIVFTRSSTGGAGAKRPCGLLWLWMPAHLQILTMILKIIPPILFSRGHVIRKEGIACSAQLTLRIPVTSSLRCWLGVLQIHTGCFNRCLRRFLCTLCNVSSVSTTSSISTRLFLLVSGRMRHPASSPRRWRQCLAT